MKKLSLLTIMFIYIICSLSVNAQTDMTSLISNPSFEDNVGDVADGWTYSDNCDTLAWYTINTDGDDTKTGDNICGLWNSVFGDHYIMQEITGVESGIYKVTADLMCSSNAYSSRLTTQRIFINDKSVLFGVDADTNYSENDLSILTNDLGEQITFAGYTVSPVGQETGPFNTCEVVDTVTDGTIKLGIKTNGSVSEYSFSFPNLTDGDGWGWFKVDNFTLTKIGDVSAISDIQSDDLKVLVNDGYISVEGVEDFKIYTINGSIVRSDAQLPDGVYIVVANEQVTKVLVTK